MYLRLLHDVLASRNLIDDEPTNEELSQAEQLEIGTQVASALLQKECQMSVLEELHNAPSAEK